MKTNFYTYLCKGYDKIHNSYANPQKMTSNLILNEEKLKEKKEGWFETPPGITQSKSYTIVETSKYKAEQAFGQSCGVSYNEIRIAASADLSSNHVNAMEENSAYGKVYSSYQTKQYRMALDEEQLQNCITDEFQRDVESCDPEKIFEKYGTHLILGFSIGGRIVMEFSMTDRQKKSIDEIRTAANFKFSSIGTNISMEQKRAIEFFNSRADVELWAIGGRPAALINWESRTEVLDEWKDSLEEEPALYQVTHEIPVWKLVSDSDLSKKLENGFENYYKKGLLEAMKKIPFITDLRVIMTGSSDIRDQLKEGEFVTQMWEKGDTFSNSDLNARAGGKYIYLVYKFGTDLSKKITDVRVISNSSNNTDPNPKGYTVIKSDLNAKAGGHYIYLQYKTDNQEMVPGIYALRTKENTTPFSDDWKPVVDQNNETADLNKRAGGKYIYMYYYVHPYVEKLCELYSRLR